MTRTVPFVAAEGDPFAIGAAHGAARAAQLRAFLGDGLGRLNHLVRPAVTMAGLRDTIAAHRTEIEAATPALAEEIRGLAAGAGISPDEALLLQLRREILGYRRVRADGDCTTYALSGADPVLAQTIDLNGNLDDQLAVLDVAVTGSGRRALVLSFAGLLGYLGLNSDGLAVGLNLVLGGRWAPGVPPYLAIRHVLDNASDVDGAIAVLRGLKLASSRSITVCDAHSAAWLEIVGTETRVVRAHRTVHTNHLLHPDLADRDELNVFARNSSLRRLAACQAGVEALPEHAGAHEHFAVLSAPPIHVPDEGDITRERTVATVVLLPARGELHVRPAGASAAVFSLQVPLGEPGVQPQGPPTSRSQCGQTVSVAG
ncbi:C45 family peptidase [Actinophytocola sp.]|uniref:C45 family peptidase n=1 Tax=Actinophytocola sp. TaxID=1872138 RepID=UPI002D7F44FA|nr:C45 family peptidase [Actinophytocola sp.]HET9140284.1 C45 family peptidase [Actinophytocola sp.]